MSAGPAPRLTRSRFLVRAAAGAGGVALAGGGLAANASAAEAELDLAWLRFGITLEFTSAAYYAQARRSGLFTRGETRVLERATAAENAHKEKLREALRSAGEAPIDEADLEVRFPAGAFDDRASAIALGRSIESMSVHAYLGALVEISNPVIRLQVAPLAAAEAGQLAYLKGLSGPPLTAPFPSVHGLATAAEELARYLP